jgi:predicted RNA binding protein YcfA (HicA-like mRNA interferase family)
VGAVLTKIGVCRHTFKLIFSKVFVRGTHAFYVHPVYKFTNVDTRRITQPGGPGVGYPCSRLV